MAIAHGFILFLLLALAACAFAADGAMAQTRELPAHGCNRPDLDALRAKFYCLDWMESGTVHPRYLALMFHRKGANDFRGANVLGIKGDEQFKEFADSRRKFLERAIDSFNKALGIDPDLVLTLHMRGLAYLMLGRYPEGIDDFNAVASLRPRAASPFMGRALASLLAGDHPRALHESSECLRRNWQAKDCLFLRGITLNRLGDVGGDADLQTARQIDPKVGAFYEKQFGLVR